MMKKMMIMMMTLHTFIVTLTDISEWVSITVTFIIKQNTIFCSIKIVRYATFFEDFITIVGSICSHTSNIQLHYRVIDGFLIFPPFVNPFCSSPAIHSDHITRTFSLKGLLSDTSRDCNWLVRPPGIIATSVL